MHCITQISNSRSLFLVVLLLNFEFSLCQHHVCLSQEIENGSLILRCSVDRLAFEVSFFFNSTSFGFCLPSTSQSDKIVKCDKNITQNTETNVTVLNIRDTNLYKFIGIWTCNHGSYKQSIDVKIPKDLDQSLFQEIRPCHEKLCLTWYQQQNELILICEVPQLYLEVIFHYGENEDYAYCTSPLPIPHCFSPHKNSEITQDFKKKRTILRLSSNQLNTLNGKWACSHGSDIDSVTVKMVNASLCLKGIIRNEQLHLECRAHNLLSDIDIYDPDGSLYGGCRLPTKYHNGTVICDSAKDISLDLDRYIMHVFMKFDHTFDKFGEWKCKQKFTFYEDSFQIKKIPETEKYFIGGQLTLNVFLCFLVIGLLGYIIKPHLEKSWRVKGRNQLKTAQQESQPLLRKDDADNDEYIRQTKPCMVCGNSTAYSFCCNCKKFICEPCYEHHLSDESHTIIQIENYKVSAHSTKCMNLNCMKNSARVCLHCEEIFCDKCASEHVHQDDMIVKTLLLKTHDPNTETKVSISSDQTEIIKTISIPDDKLPTRICGIAFLVDDNIALVDFSNKKIKIFRGNIFQFKITLSKEPRCMTGLHSNVIAVTFPYEKFVMIYDIDLVKKKPKKVETLDLNDIGKPYSIAYNQERFAVEIDAEDDGFIGIMNMNGDLICRIDSAKNYAFFTGHTIRLALDTHNERVIISAMSKKAVTCLDFKGNKKWTLTIPSPRGVVFGPVNAKDKRRMIFVASKRGKTIYEINSVTGTSTLLVSSSVILNPRHIAYNKENNHFCVHVLSKDIEEDENDKIAIFKYHESH